MGLRRETALGKGLSVLFAGPSGTGKTMTVDIIAGEVGLDLYKIDLSTVISKYIGEMEKNLSRIFAGAETSNSILFFDEADALFGKRSEVRDSHDRYANIDIGYLLQQMEEYEGAVILATNFRENMDEAFVRRLHCGTLWEGRDKSGPVDTERYVLEGSRYIELNPLRAGIVCRPSNTVGPVLVPRPAYPRPATRSRPLLLGDGRDGAAKPEPLPGVCVTRCPTVRADSHSRGLATRAAYWKRTVC
jgi:hypothetical protein